MVIRTEDVMRGGAERGLGGEEEKLMVVIMVKVRRERNRKQTGRLQRDVTQQ